MPRSAPEVDNTGSAPAYVHVAYRFIDFSGDLRTVSMDLDPTAATDTLIEALAVEYGTASNADLYAIEVTDVWGAVADASNAVETTGKSNSVYDNLVVQMKNVTNQSVRVYIPAPVSNLFVGGTDQIDGESTPLANFLTDALALFSGAGYTIVGARYTERREINEQVRF